MSSEPPPRAISAAAPRYFIKLGDHAIQISADGLVIGRSPSCAVAITAPLVSRRHARVSIAEGQPRIEDLGSANGTYVNGERLTGVRALEIGDIVLIGGSQFELATDVQLAGKLDAGAGRDVDTADDQPVFARSARGEQAAQAPDDGQVGELPRLFIHDPEDDALDEVPSTEQTRRTDVLVLFGQVANKMIAGAQAHAAEKLLGPRLREVLTETKVRPREAGELVETAAERAVRLADATGRAEWVDYVVELYSAAARPLPARIVDDLYEVIRRVPRIRVAALRGYVVMLSEGSHRLTPAERFVLQRLQGLVQLAETK